MIYSTPTVKNIDPDFYKKVRNQWKINTSNNRYQFWLNGTLLIQGRLVVQSVFWILTRLILVYMDISNQVVMYKRCFANLVYLLMIMLAVFV